MRSDAVCGVILAGGKSLRMGSDKALLPVHGKCMIARAASELTCVTDEIIISANDPVRYGFLGYPAIPDAFCGQGPLAGLHAAMRRTSRPLVLLLACDLPAVGAQLLRRLIDSSPGFDAVIPRTTNGMPHPLCAVYRRTCLSSVEGALTRRDNRMTSFLDDPSLKICWLSPEDGSFRDEDLVNLNNPSDLDDYLVRLGSFRNDA